MRHLRAALLVTVGLAATSIVASPAGAVADELTPPPAAWADLPTLDLRLDARGNSVRIAGANRFETSLALTLVRRGMGGFPYATPDRTSGGATTLGAADGWWGTGVCPRAIVVAAGDVAADALAAAPLSDPTGQSSEPRLRRTASADPLFDPIGAFVRVDTDDAPILITDSARRGATTLSDAARIAAGDLRNGGCRQARSAIIVGGTAAVPAEVENELLSLGYAEAFRIAGTNRYDTAAQIAESLGTAPVGSSPDCADERSDDGDARRSFQGNAAVEFRRDAGSCEVLARTVVVTDGIVGADALAAGWWTSYHQVPVLLHDGSATLPEATRRTLATTEIDHVIVVGGTARVSDVVAATIATTAGAEVRRVAGPNRTATSVEMARHLGGWFPDDTQGGYANSMVCIAASSGDAVTGRGWPDALGVAPLCGGLDGSIALTSAPARAVAPVSGPFPQIIGGPAAPRGRDAVPVLVTFAGIDGVAPEIRDLMRDVFPIDRAWCTSAVDPAECEQPGFAVIAGGASVVTDVAARQIDALVSGSDADFEPIADVIGPFWTALDLGPVHDRAPGTGGAVCLGRGGLEHARWLVGFDGPEGQRVVASNDVMLSGRYQTDGDGVGRSPGTSAPVCAPIDVVDADDVLEVRGVGPTGSLSPAIAVGIDPTRRLRLDAPLSAAGAEASGGAGLDQDDPDGGATTRTATTAVGPAIQSRGVVAATLAASVELTLVRGIEATDPDTFTATWQIDTDEGVITGTATGEAVFDGTVWRLRGRTELGPGTWNADAGMGGFVADIELDDASPGDPLLETFTWQVDAVVQ